MHCPHERIAAVHRFNYQAVSGAAAAQIEFYRRITMSLNDTPSGERVHIGFFGKRNAGKSSIVNAVTGQNLSVVSDHKGTTTDPVRKSMELLPLGPVLIIDTPGYDDMGDLGQRRVAKTREILGESDLAILVVDKETGPGKEDEELIALFEERKIPWLLVINKADLDTSLPGFSIEGIAENRIIEVSAKTGFHIHELKEKIAMMLPKEEKEKRLVADLISPGSQVILVIPIDKAAPKGRLILPQQQTIRDILDAGAAAVCVRDSELEDYMMRLPENPDLVITDSQVFEEVAEIVPQEIPLTSFSILMARYKGFLEEAWHGADVIDDLRDGDRILISEGCTHHRQCDDIGTVKIPRWLTAYTGADLIIETSSGREFPLDLSPYKLVVHCGGCMLNEKEMTRRMETALSQGTSFTNYGIVIAKMKGILERSKNIFME